MEYFPSTKNDFVTTIQNIKNVSPDILLSFCVSANQNTLYQALYDAGITNIPVISTTGVGLSYVHRLCPPPCMDNTFFMSSYLEELDTPAAQQFTDKLRQKYSAHQVPYIEFDAETAYTSVYLYKKAVEMAGTTEAEAVIEALESEKISYNGPGGTVTICGENHHVIRDEILFRVTQNHTIEKILDAPGLYTDFVNRALAQEFGPSYTLDVLGVNAPNVQYNMLFHKIV